MVFRLAAAAIEVLVQRSAAAVVEVGDDEAGIGAVAAGLNAGNDATDPAPGFGGIVEMLWGERQAAWHLRRSDQTKR
jgi:hypothetical protein